MRTRSILSMSAVLCIAGLICLPARADLIGSQVTLNPACCATTSNISSTEGPVTVGPAIKFPEGAIPYYPPIQIDVTGSQIIITDVDANTTYSTGGFNGFIFTFTGAPLITSVTLDSASTLDPVGFTFTSDVVVVNFAGLATNAGDTTILDVNAVAATPEPSSFALLGTGLLGLGAALRRRFA